MLDWFAKRNASPMAEAFATDFPMVATGHAGFLPGTMVATSLGWRPVEALQAGDEVLTFDHGMRPVKAIHRRREVLGETGSEADMAALYIPRDALGNRSPLWVRPEQGILIEHELLEDNQGDPFAVVPACALEGYRGITRAAQRVIMDLVSLEFDEDEVVYIEAGVLAFCPAKVDLMHYCMSDRDALLYNILPPAEARELVIDMITEDSFWTPGAIAGSGGEPQYAAYS